MRFHSNPGPKSPPALRVPSLRQSKCTGAAACPSVSPARFWMYSRCAKHGRAEAKMGGKWANRGPGQQAMGLQWCMRAGGRLPSRGRALRVGLERFQFSEERGGGWDRSTRVAQQQGLGAAARKLVQHG